MKSNFIKEKNNICIIHHIFQSSPPSFSPKDRTNDVDAILYCIERAEKFIYISVMDYFPLTVYTPKIKYVFINIITYICLLIYFLFIFIYINKYEYIELNVCIYNILYVVYSQN